MLLPVVRLIARLPLRLLQSIGAGTGLLAYALSGGYRRKLHGNLAAAGFDTPQRARSAAREAGRAAFEAPWVWFRPSADLAARANIEQLEVFERAIKAGRGVILLTPHLGSFEAAARMVASDRPLTVLFKPPRLAAARALVEAARSRSGLTALPANGAGLRGLLRALRRGEAVGILPDQVPTDGDGVWAPFFGRQAYTMTLPERLARATGAPIVMGFAERLPAGRGWAGRFMALEGDGSPASINAAMEVMIRQVPEQYLWGYNRYKAPARAAPRPSDEATPGRGAD